jgi:hypothetical protein
MPLESLNCNEFDALAVKDLLEQATKAEPKFSLGQAMLARAWSQLGYQQKREQEAKQALDPSIDLAVWIECNWRAITTRVCQTTTSFLGSRSYFNTDTPPRTGVLVKRSQVR